MVTEVKTEAEKKAEGFRDRLIAAAKARFEADKDLSKQEDFDKFIQAVKVIGDVHVACDIPLKHFAAAARYYGDCGAEEVKRAGG